jgi:hypothetical protein
MARQIESVIEMTRAQTEQFIASLNNPKNAKARDKTIKKALKMKFNVF